MSDFEDDGPGADDYDDDMDYGDLPGDASGLPEGIQKTVLTPAPDDNYAKPKAGDEVHVHYTGWLLDGTKFDSSRDRPGDFSFTLGKGAVIQGWDKGVATMKKGEVAEFVLAPEFAYGAAGSPPKIPENATLKFEVELLSWKSKDMLTEDGGVLKTVEKAGEGWKKPAKDGACLVRYVGKLADGTEFARSPEEGVEIDLAASETPMGLPLATLQMVLPTMKKGEHSTLKLSAPYAFGDAGHAQWKVPASTGVEYDITLLEIFTVDDCALYKDKRSGDYMRFPTVWKKELKEGDKDSYEKPGHFSKVTMTLRVDGPSGALLPEKTLEFALTTGVHCEALEAAVSKMTKGSSALITVEDVSICQDNTLGLAPEAGPIKFYVTLQDFEKATDTWNMSNAEKVAHGEKLKAAGTAFIKAQEWRRACSLYKACADVFSYIDNWEAKEKGEGETLKKACKGNEAQGWLKLEQWREVVKLCDDILKEDTFNIKALNRRGQAYLGLKETELAQRDFKRMLETEPSNAEAKRQLARCQQLIKEEDKKSKGLFANMCKALGKGPVREPYKEKSMDMDDEDDAMDDDGGDEPADTDMGA